MQEDSKKLEARQMEEEQDTILRLQYDFEFV